MAEALDLNIPLGEGGAESVENIIKPLLDLEKEKSQKHQTIRFRSRTIIQMTLLVLMY